MRLVLAEMMHEADAFPPTPTPLEQSQRALAGPPSTSIGHGRGARALRGHRHLARRLIQVAREAKAEITLPIAGGAPPSGRIDDAAFETFAWAITGAVAKGCDAVLLALHGAMATRSHDDGEGELLRRIRALAPDVPIAVALDLHTNMSRAMVDNATVIAGYRTYPHVDTAETGLRAGRVLVRALRGEVASAMRMA